MATELERIATALEQIALALIEKEQAPQPLMFTAPAPGPFPPIGGGQPPAPWVCPVHHSTRLVPAGISKRTGQPYTRSLPALSRGCNEKPPRIGQPAPLRAVPSSEGVQGRELP